MANIKIRLIIQIHILLILCFTPSWLLFLKLFNLFCSPKILITLKHTFKTLSNCNKIAELMRLLSNTNFDCLKQILTSSCIYFQQGIVDRAILNPLLWRSPQYWLSPFFKFCPTLTHPYISTPPVMCSQQLPLLHWMNNSLISKIYFPQFTFQKLFTWIISVD